MGLLDTPRAERLHIALFGRRNSGKSSLLNSLVGQSISLVSETPGTTTDPVYKAMELHGAGPVVFIDTAGFDDVGELGAMRTERTERAALETDIALLLFSEGDLTEELRWRARLKRAGVPVILVVSRADEREAGGRVLAAIVEARTGERPLIVSSDTGEGVEELRAEIMRSIPEDYGGRSIMGGLCEAGDTVLLVMPQDKEAPKGRLILPQVQTLRELLDMGALPLSSTVETMPAMLAALKEPPKLIVTDSQAFARVHELTPPESRLTSFSVLFAAYKGDITYFVESARKIAGLGEGAHILIAEACTHKPIEEDIGRVKLPRLLKKRLGDKISVEVVAGKDFPDNLAPYDLIIHCGSCMFNRRYVLSRVAAARSQGVPMTNYGVAIAYLLGILDDVELPRP